MLGVFHLAAETVGIPASLLIAICSVESDFRDVVNKHDGGSPSIGICQIKLDTARLVGFEGTEEQLLRDRLINILYAAKYIKRQLNRYKGDYCSAISAYNTGTRRYLTDGRFNNMRYVTKVLERWKRYSSGDLPLTKTQLESCDGGTQGWVTQNLKSV